MPLYPLKFAPRLVPKIWGGQRLANVLGKPLPPHFAIGESWEIYDFPPGLVENSTGWVSAVIINGPLAGQTLHDLVGQFGRDLYGDAALVGTGQFPILIKFLDAREDLSVQVHPDAAFASQNADCHLKTEAWFVLQHEPGAAIYKGLTPGTTREQFKAGIDNGTVMDHIVRIPVEDGQCHFLPSGTVHALGAGVLVAEVQTPSDTTFRVFDFNRIEESTGKPRALHVEQALQCIDFSEQADPSPSHKDFDAGVRSAKLVDSPYFTIEKVRLEAGVEEILTDGEPVVWMMLEGEATLRVTDVDEPTQLRKGDTVLLPAKMNEPILETMTDCLWLAVTFPPTGGGQVETGIH